MTDEERARRIQSKIHYFEEDRLPGDPGLSEREAGLMVDLEEVRQKLEEHDSKKLLKIFLIFRKELELTKAGDYMEAGVVVEESEEKARKLLAKGDGDLGGAMDEGEEYWMTDAVICQMVGSAIPNFNPQILSAEVCYHPGGAVTISNEDRIPKTNEEG